jgi:CubicO group peptidase (beta-lactamase class C family)
MLTRLRRRHSMWRSTRRSRLAAVATLLVGGALTACALDRPLHAATGITAHSLCTERFVAGRDPTRMLREHIRGAAGTRLLHGLLRARVDSTHAEVRASVLGAAASRARFVPGRGCTLVHGGSALAPVPPAGLPFAPDPLDAPPEVVAAGDPVVRRALDDAFAATDRGRPLHVKAIVVVRDGRIVAERYAPGYDPASRFHTWSVAKSVTNALVGSLVADGALRVDMPAPVPEWREAGDPRHGVTVDALLRMTSGLPAQTGSGFDGNSRMLFQERDMAAFAAREALASAPGSRWAYTDANYALLSRLVLAAVGGSPADVVRFAHARIFGPLGMRSALFEFDGAGTPLGATHVIATARDWARFGWLYAQDGVVGGARLLPAGWVDYSARPTPAAAYGYGAGFWTNRGESAGAVRRRAAGAPGDSFFASGNFGQVILVSPAHHLVIVRLALSHDAQGQASIASVNRLARALVARTNAGSPGVTPTPAPHGR